MHHDVEKGRIMMGKKGKWSQISRMLPGKFVRRPRAGFPPRPPHKNKSDLALSFKIQYLMNFGSK